MKGLTIAVSISWVLGACGSSSDAPARESPQLTCEKYREHLLDIRLAGATADREAHRRALRDSLGSDFIDDCVSNTSQAAIDCAMAASSNDQLRVCSSRH